MSREMAFLYVLVISCYIINTQALKILIPAFCASENMFHSQYYSSCGCRRIPACRGLNCIGRLRIRSPLWLRRAHIRMMCFSCTGMSCRCKWQFWLKYALDSSQKSPPPPLKIQTSIWRHNWISIDGLNNRSVHQSWKSSDGGGILACRWYGPVSDSSRQLLAFRADCWGASA